MNGTILISGAGGQVGHALSIADSPYRLIALERSGLDITKPEEIEAALDRHEPAIVINAAAYTQVDRAEEEAESAFAVNRDGPAHLAFACGQRQIPLLHVSTDYVFDGSKQGTYQENDAVAPLGVYGESKAEGEAVLRDTLEQHLVLRTSWVFSATGNNFVKTMLRLGRERDRLAIVDDQHGCPTSARSIAATLLEIADSYLRGEAMEWGIFHFCNAPPTTWFDFAREIFRRAGGYDRLALDPIPSSEYPTAAQRPRNSVLDCSRIEKSYGIQQPGWSEELGQVVQMILRRE